MKIFLTCDELSSLLTVPVVHPLGLLLSGLETWLGVDSQILLTGGAELTPRPPNRSARGPVEGEDNKYIIYYNYANTFRFCPFLILFKLGRSLRIQSCSTWCPGLGVQAVRHYPHWNWLQGCCHRPHVMQYGGSSMYTKYGLYQRLNQGPLARLWCKHRTSVAFMWRHYHQSGSEMRFKLQKLHTLFLHYSYLRWF